MDFAEKRWRKVKDLGGRVFLLSLFYFGASCAAGGDDDGHGLVYPVRKVRPKHVVYIYSEGPRLNARGGPPLNAHGCPWFSCFLFVVLTSDSRKKEKETTGALPGCQSYTWKYFLLHARTEKKKIQWGPSFVRTCGG